MSIRHTLHFTMVGDLGVLLDTKCDRYIGLGARTANRIAHAAAKSSTLSDIDPETRFDLEAALGYPLSDHYRRLRHVEPTLARRSQAATPLEIDSAHSLGPALVCLRSLLDAHRLLERPSLAGVFERLAERKGRLSRRSPKLSAESVADVFADVRPWFPIKPICRLDGLALALANWRFGNRVDLLWGVALDPFRAHCWVQDGDQVLLGNDEDVRRYSPILTV